MNLVDSSGWLSYLADEANADAFAEPLADTEALVLPTIVVCEVTRALLRERGPAEARHAYSAMLRGVVVDLTAEIGLRAARLSVERRLPLADSIILATAQATEAVIWTEDAHFADLPGVRHFAKRPAGT